jgi:hypothetical protein
LVVRELLVREMLVELQDLNLMLITQLMVGIQELAVAVELAVLVATLFKTLMATLVMAV